MKRLIVGPYVGELGWELFCFQARIRELSKQFNETQVFCKKGHSILYSDFAIVNEISRDVPLEANGAKSKKPFHWEAPLVTKDDHLVPP